MMGGQGPSNSNTDDGVEEALQNALSLRSPRSFFLFAGAGSGKTRTLVNALGHLRRTYREQLRVHGKQVAVITYTNAACDEIVRRTEHDSLFNVRTIHSFVWQQIQGLNADIKKWLRVNLRTEIDRLLDEEQKGRAGTKASAVRQKQIESKTKRLERLNSIKSFSYNPNGDNREKNSLNHAEVVKIFASFVEGKPVMRQMLADKFPFILIDESQDTNRALVESLLLLQREHHQSFLLGLIGDTMQRIFPEGKERIEDDIPSGWLTPAKRMNHRCPKRIVRLINQIRASTDSHHQLARDDAPNGWVRLFVLPSASSDKPGLERRARAFMAGVTGDSEWNNAESCKTLTLEHHMAASRMGFEGLFEPLASVDEFYTSLVDGTFAPTKFFTHNILPLVKAHQRNDKFAIAKIAREFSPLLAKEVLRQSNSPDAQLKATQKAIASLLQLWTSTVPTCGSILENVAASSLFEIPDRLNAALAGRQTEELASEQGEARNQLGEDVAALVTFLDCPFSVIEPYAAYVSGTAPYDTHQGVKGLEFERVMVLIDDGQARGFMFSYEKLFGAKEPSATDVTNQRSGKDSSIDRTRRLFYVTCSRAKSALALVVYSDNPEAVKRQVCSNGWFDESEVLLQLPT